MNSSLPRQSNHSTHPLTIDPATANTAAIRAYEKAGSQAVGVMHRYERNVDGDG
jgi:aminoglycoside 6'-N-acetyltransferase